MTRVKICGINSPDALAAAAEADWIGFNFYPPSPRYVTPPQAAALAGGRCRVGLFVDPADDEVAVAVAVASLDVLQVYAGPARVAALRSRFGRPVWRAVGVATRADLPAAAEEVDGYVVEAKPPPGATRPGGNAVSFDWTVLDGWASPKPWLLAGGLKPGVIAAAVAASGAPAVDVASGVERARGVKDPALIRAFIAEAHALATS